MQAQGQLFDNKVVAEEPEDDEEEQLVEEDQDFDVVADRMCNAHTVHWGDVNAAVEYGVDIIPALQPVYVRELDDAVDIPS